MGPIAASEQLPLRKAIVNTSPLTYASASSGIRAHDLPLTERVLCQLSYRGSCEEALCPSVADMACASAMALQVRALESRPHDSTTSIITISD